MAASCRQWGFRSIIGGSCHKHHFCRDKHGFALTKHAFCRDESMFVTTKVCLSQERFLLQVYFCDVLVAKCVFCHDKSFVTTNTCLSQQKYFITSFVMASILLWWQKMCFVFHCDKNGTCGSSHQWQRSDSMTMLLLSCARPANRLVVTVIANFRQELLQAR